MQYTKHILISFILLSLVLASGCVQKNKLKDYDKFKSSVMYNMTEHLEQYNDPALWGEHPCTAMVCVNESDSYLSKLWLKIKSLFSEGLMDSHLAGTQCYFLNCNATSFNKTLSKYDGTINWGDCKIDGKTLKCAPRFFMLGQGTDNIDYTIAQQYSQGRLNMPVLWVKQRVNKPPVPPQPSNLMCYLSKNQMPVVVWYTKGKYINDPAYTKMLKRYNVQNEQYQIEGPIIVTTEAMIDPYIHNTNNAAKKTLNISLLNNIKSQLESIRAYCPKCLSALSLKPTFDEKGLPDLCPLTYFFDIKTMDPNKFYAPDPLNCSPKYPSIASYNSRPSKTIMNFSNKIDMIGVGFIANDAKNMSTCTPFNPLARHFLFSKQTLNNFQKPSVWYAVGMSPGTTATPLCSFSEYDVAKTYESMLKDIPGYVAAGIIGISPYKFLDSTDSPLKNSSANVNSTAYQYGFMNSKGNQKILQTYSWFSNVQFYFTNKGPLFETTLTSARVSSNQLIKSSDGLYSLQVKVINKSSDKESIFFAQDSKHYLAKKDGAFVDIFDIPLPKHAFAQPIFFSRSGTGGVCSAAEAVKMTTRSPLSKNRNPNSKELRPPDDSEQRKKISKMQCGVCLATAPMPKAFCKLKNSYSSSSISFPEEACTDYPSIDIPFLQKNLDNIFMRAIAVQETSLGGSSPDSSNPPACKIAKYTTTSCLRNQDKSIPYKTKSALNSLNSSACTAQIISDNVNSLPSDNPAACGIGLMQCIDGVHENTKYTSTCGGDEYNPYEPKDSACCGANVFSSKFISAQDFLYNYLSSSSNIAKVGPGELNWYAAWIAAYAYYGIDIKPLIRTYSDTTTTLVSYVNSLLQSKYSINPNIDYKYGSKIILRYNNAINECNSGCLYRDCSASSSGSGSLDGDASDSDVVDDGYEDEFFIPIDG